MTKAQDPRHDVQRLERLLDGLRDTLDPVLDERLVELLDEVRTTMLDGIKPDVKSETAARWSTRPPLTPDERKASELFGAHELDMQRALGLETWLAVKLGTIDHKLAVLEGEAEWIPGNVLERVDKGFRDSLVRMNTRIADMGAQVDALAKTVEVFTQDQAAALDEGSAYTPDEQLASRLDKLERKLMSGPKYGAARFDERLNANEARIDKLKHDFCSYRRNVDNAIQHGIERRTSLDERVRALERKEDAQAEMYDYLAKSYECFIERFAELERKVASHSEGFGRDWIASVDKRTDKLERTVGAQAKLLTSFSGLLKTTPDDLDSLGGRLDAHRARLNDINLLLGDRIEGVKSQVEIVVKHCGELERKVATTHGPDYAAARVVQRLDVTDRRLDSVANRLGEVETIMDSFERRIETLRKAHNGRVSIVDETYVELDKRVDNLADRVDEDLLVIDKQAGQLAKIEPMEIDKRLRKLEAALQEALDCKQCRGSGIYDVYDYDENEPCLTCKGSGKRDLVNDFDTFEQSMSRRMSSIERVRGDLAELGERVRKIEARPDNLESLKRVVNERFKSRDDRLRRLERYVGPDKLDAFDQGLRHKTTHAAEFERDRGEPLATMSVDELAALGHVHPQAKGGDDV